EDDLRRADTPHRPAGRRLPVDPPVRRPVATGTKLLVATVKGTPSRVPLPCPVVPLQLLAVQLRPVDPAGRLEPVEAHVRLLAADRLHALDVEVFLRLDADRLGMPGHASFLRVVKAFIQSAGVILADSPDGTTTARLRGPRPADYDAFRRRRETTAPV